ncbi:MAG: HEAT repeat domain-containing protein [Oscillochloridaceae bacterium]|nr:HEAT repeat domain-containing protein [Chloroflexaceae bacterium]MDW8390825.1 HEAT repeat domain-containing protein [Oscillochloridaceae bacterium]
MLTSKTFTFLLGKRAARVQRAALEAFLGREPGLQALPGLLDAPLGLEPLPDPAAILAAPSHLAICGPPASGRTLALLQVAARWCATGSGAPVVYLSLSDEDAPNLPPRAILAGAFERAGLPPAFGARPGILLLDDWETLPTDRRLAWRAFLTATGREWRALRLVVVLPESEEWTGFRTLDVPGDVETQAAWLRHLLPAEAPERLLAALRAGSGGAAIRLADVALLALTLPDHGLPASRAELYARAYEALRPAVERGDPDDPVPLPAVGRALLRHYRMARAFAGSAEIGGLASLPPIERIAVAPLAAGLLGTPAPVLAALWSTNAPSGASLDAGVACLLAMPDQAPEWGLRLVEHLARPEASAEERAALRSLAPVLPRIFAASPEVERASAALRAADAALPPVAGRWLPLVDDADAPAALRWAAADLLARHGLERELATAVPEAPDSPALQMRAFLAATAVEGGVALLATPPLRAGAVALLGDASIGEPRLAVAQAILADASSPDDLRALALIGDRAALEQALCSPVTVLRRAALAILREEDPAVAAPLLARALKHPEATVATCGEALDTLAALEHPGATALLIRALLDEQLGLVTRLRALRLLASRGRAGIQVLRRALEAGRLPLAVRAAAAAHLGRLEDDGALPLLRNLLESDAPPMLRHSAAEAIGALGRRAELADQAAAALITGLRRAGVNAALMVAIARGLGRSGANAALPPLRSLLGLALADVLRAAWERRVPELASLPARAWLALALSAETRVALIDALAQGETLADQPSSLAECCARQAERIAEAAALALGDLARARPDLQPAVRITLRRTAAADTRPAVIRAALDSLASCSDPAEELEALLDDAAVSLPSQWLALERLGRLAPAREALTRRLNGGDPFLRAAMVTLLAAQGHEAALPAMRRLARDPAGDPHLRRAAIAALGRFPPAEVSATLVTLAADESVPADLRALAAATLPATLSTDERAALYRALRVARQPEEVEAALARALARAGEREALPVLLRLARSESGAAASASLEALAEVGDDSVEPVLVAVSQSHLAAPAVRLAAVAALLRLCGPAHLTLLREYLTSASTPLRIRAYAVLAAACPDDPRLGEPLTDPAAPLALRLQALEHLAARDPAAPALEAVLTRPDEEPQIRLAAARALMRGGPTAPAALAAALADAPDQPPAPPLLRRRCIEALATLAQGNNAAASAALERLNALAETPDQPEAQHWAGEALWHFGF